MRTSTAISGGSLLTLVAPMYYFRSAGRSCACGLFIFEEHARPSNWDRPDSGSLEFESMRPVRVVISDFLIRTGGCSRIFRKLSGTYFSGNRAFIA
jgi:hypothetical protein